MRFVYFTHSLASCWNHGNAHFLRGVLRELIACAATQVEAFEPGGSWSLRNLLDGPRRGRSRRLSRAPIPELSVAHSTTLTSIVEAAARRRRRRDRARMERALARRRHRPSAAARRAASRCCSTTRIIARSAIRRRSAPSTSTATTACSPSARRWPRSTAAGAGATASSSGTRPPTRACSTRRPTRAEREGLVWIGNWGDGERSAELESFLLRPGARPSACRSTSTACAIRTQALDDARAGTARAIAAGSRMRGARDLRPPSRDRARAAPLLRRRAAGHPDHPGVRGAGLRHPARLRAVARCGGSVPARRRISWSRQTRREMERHLAALRDDPALRAALVASGLETIRARHTCAHRVDELLAIVERIARRARRRRCAHEDRLLRLEPAVLLLERRRDLLSRAAQRSRRAAAIDITFYEPDAFDRQKHRDIDPPDWADARRLSGDRGSGAAA